eukprot:GHVR01077509.1.p1 GENE.GHVR01077509.1~~GHVR01077509.1.p1  ORF type:complete len:377 (-),score=108.06 GHVR01077509.1:145-1233(-)
MDTSFTKPILFGFNDATASNTATRSESVQFIQSKKCLGDIPSVDNTKKPVCDAFIHGVGEVDQLGLGDTRREKRKPFPLKMNVGVVDVSVGSIHSALLTEDGDIYTFGCNDEGALGREGEETLPLKVDLPVSPSILPEGQVYGKVKKVSCGDSHTVAVTWEGRVYSWGSYRNSTGECGFPDFTSADYIAVRKQTVPVEVKIPVDVNDCVCDVVAGANHTLALTKNGQVFSWGTNEFGQQGDVSTGDVDMRDMTTAKHILYPKNISGRIGMKVDSIFATVNSTFFLNKDSGTVKACGLNNDAQLGVFHKGYTVDSAVDVVSLQGIPLLKVCGGGFSSCALAVSGVVYSWGRGVCVCVCMCVCV